MVLWHFKKVRYHSGAGGSSGGSDGGSNGGAGGGTVDYAAPGPRPKTPSNAPPAVDWMHNGVYKEGVVLGRQ